MTDASRAMNVVWHIAKDEQQWIADCVDALNAALRGALEASLDVRLLLSGGTTPAPVYQALGEYALDWACVRVGLIDDRDVEPDAEGSNAKLVRESLLRGAAAAARFTPLRDYGESLDSAVARANAAWGDDDGTASLVIAALGMGDDGHTASLFPGARNLDAAFASRDPYIAIDATGCAVAGAFTQRISMTPAALAKTSKRYLLIRGAEKRATLERAIEDGYARDMPIRVVLDLADAPLHVYWCA